MEISNSAQTLLYSVNSMDSTTMYGINTCAIDMTKLMDESGNNDAYKSSTTPPPVVAEDQQLLQSPKFYIGDQLEHGEAKIDESEEGQIVVQSLIMHNTLSDAAHLMEDSAKKLAYHKSCDSGYSLLIQTDDSNAIRFVPSDAFILTNIEGNGRTGSNSVTDSGIEDFFTSAESGSPQKSSMFCCGSYRQVYSIFLQVLLAVTISAFGNSGAGLFLDENTQSMNFYRRIPEVLYLVPTLLGLKGNLEMTMVSRLSTDAHRGVFNSLRKTMRIMFFNISMVESQAIIVSFMASILTFVASGIEKFASHFSTVSSEIVDVATTVTTTTITGTELDNVTADFSTKVLIIFATSIATAAFTCLISSVIVIGLVVVCTHFNWDTDNFATPIAASLGDILTSFLLGYIGETIFQASVYIPSTEYRVAGVRYYQEIASYWPTLTILIISIAVMPLLVKIVGKDKQVSEVFFSRACWVPITLGMMVSFFSGCLLRVGSVKFRTMSLFQPLINGVGGNLASISASRLGTAFHLSSRENVNEKDSMIPAELRKNVCVTRSLKKSVINTLKSFASNDLENKLVLVFVIISVLVHLIYGQLLPIIQGIDYITGTFYAFYIIGATLQVIILTVGARFLVNFVTSFGWDPDTSAIPILTGTGDFLGTTFLYFVFFTLLLLDDPTATTAIAEENGATEQLMEVTSQLVLGVTYKRM